MRIIRVLEVSNQERTSPKDARSMRSQQSLERSVVPRRKDKEGACLRGGSGGYQHVGMGHVKRLPARMNVSALLTEVTKSTSTQGDDRVNAQPAVGPPEGEGPGSATTCQGARAGARGTQADDHPLHKLQVRADSDQSRPQPAPGRESSAHTQTSGGKQTQRVVTQGGRASTEREPATRRRGQQRLPVASTGDVVPVLNP